MGVSKEAKRLTGLKANRLTDRQRKGELTIKSSNNQPLAQRKLTFSSTKLNGFCHSNAMLGIQVSILQNC